MKAFCFSLCFLLSVSCFSVRVSSGQLSPTDTRIMFRIQKLLEHPKPLDQWSNRTSFCYLPPTASLKIGCADNNRVTELTVVGDFKFSQRTLSENFKIDALFTVLAELASLKQLSLVSLGLWGPIPPKINLLWSLQSLNLSSNSISGNLPPSISSMTNLKFLILSSNEIGPNFPSLGTNLSTIVLSNNSIRSQLPMGLRKFTQLQRLDVSWNGLFGKVPIFIFSLPSIQYIDLGHNQLKGPFPTNASCGKNLSFTDISQNLLTGNLPPCLGIGSNRTVLWSWNCLSNGYLKKQHPYSYCHKEALAVKPPGERVSEDSKTKLGFVLGVAGGILGILVVLGLVVFRRIRLGRDKGRCFDGSDHKRSVLGSPKPVTDARRAPPTMGVMGVSPYHVFTLEEIEDVTGNFDSSNLVGEGPEGQIYKGWASDGSVVQVRCIKVKQKQMGEKMNMEAMSKLRHRNLVSVVGHCINVTDHPNRQASATLFIVLENAYNWTLRDYLTDLRKKDKLKWPQRLSISMGIARGVQFLHTGMAPGVFENNLKAENVMLDESLTAKISGYNIPLTSSKMGSESPLYGIGIDVSNTLISPETAEKEDIHNLGAILAEVITGKSVKATSELDKLKLQLEKSLTDGVSKLQDITDPCIRGTFAFQSLRTVTEIMVNCLSNDSSQRPSIEDVLWNLQYAVQVQEGWTSSGNLSTQTY